MWVLMAAHTLSRIDDDILEGNRKTLAAAHTPYRCAAHGCEEEPRYVFTFYPNGRDDWRGSKNWQFCAEHARGSGPAEVVGMQFEEDRLVEIGMEVVREMLDEAEGGNE